jgi:hypothetical protein
MLVAGELAAGRYRHTWNAREVREGVYFCRIVTEYGATSAKVVVAR